MSTYPSRVFFKMSRIQLINGNTKKPYFVSDSGMVYQIKSPSDTCETFVKRSHIDNGIKRYIYAYVGLYPDGVAFEDLLDSDRAVAEIITSFSSTISVIK